MTTEEAWHRRHALQLAAQLPEKPSDALIILRLTAQLVTEFLMQDDEAKKPSSLVTLIKKPEEEA
jgi:hypothetical protein